MWRMLSWNWLRSRRDKKARTRGPVRPCLLSLERLEDRVVLDAAVGWSWMITIESTYVNGQAGIVQAEAAVITNSGGTLPTAEVTYLNTVDTDLIRIDNDLAAATFTGATGGINGILSKLPLSSTLAAELASLTPAIEKEMQATQLVQAQLSQITQVDGIKLVVDPIELKTNSLAKAVTNSFGAIETALIATDPADFGPALGPQGSGTPGPAGGLLQDLGVLSAHAAPPVSSAGGTTGGPIDAINAFLQFETMDLKTNDAVGHYLRKKLPGRLKSGQIALVEDLIRLDNDLIGAGGPGAAAGGIDGVLLKDAQQLQLPQGTIDEINQLVAGIGQAEQDLAGLLTEKIVIQHEGIYPASIEYGSFKAGDVSVLAQNLASSFADIEQALVSAVPDLGPALGPQGSGTPGIAGGFLQDALVLAADAAGTVPIGLAGQGNAGSVVNTYLQIETVLVQLQNAVVTTEQRAINLGVQLPPAVVNYFTQVDNALLEIDSGLVGSVGSTGVVTPGLNSLLLGVPNLPANETAELQSLTAQVQQGQQAVAAAKAAIQNTSGPMNPAGLAYLSHLPGMQTQFFDVFVGVGWSFTMIEGPLVGLVPGQQAIDASKNIADGAAKGQAQE